LKHLQFFSRSALQTPKIFNFHLKALLPGALMVLQKPDLYKYNIIDIGIKCFKKIASGTKMRTIIPITFLRALNVEYLQF
jgi:hypothetical protein